MHPIQFLDIPALDAICGHVRLPGSKSISNRALLLAALSQGATELTGVLDSDDTQVMLNALKALGCQIEFLHQQDIAQGVRITGLATQELNTALQLTRSKKTTALFLGNAGTVMRPLTAVLSLLGQTYELTGVQRMHERPIGDLVDALCQLGCQIEYLGQKGYPPLRIAPAQLDASHLSKPIAVKGNVSSQFLSALLLALPLVAQEDVVIAVIGDLISKPYIAITLKLLADFGVHVRNEGFQRFIIPAKSRYSSPKHYHVEADASSASYFIAAGAIAANQTNPLCIEGLQEDSIQGDIRFIDAARSMGANIKAQGNQLFVHRGQWPLNAIDLDCNHIPDAAMTLAVMALYAKGTTRLRNIASWKVKETDRLAAMQAQLQKLGAQVHTGDDFIEITPPERWQASSIKTYDDHRIAMCFSLAAFNPDNLPVRILEPHCVSKTYPHYFEDFFQIAQTNKKQIPVITIDGPTASGKGTIATRVAQALGFFYLDSGALYRVTALAALQQGISAEDVQALATLAKELPVTFKAGKVLYKGNEISDEIRAEEVGIMASKIAQYLPIRQALTVLQHSFQRLPGLVADGRDMGSVIFPYAPLKVFLTASATIRAQRRYKQLIEKGIPVKMDALRADLEVRDARDMHRVNAPLKPAVDAYLLDNSEQTLQESVDQVVSWWDALQPFK